jgi:tetratricopeptide (TPR) repeat protein
VPAALRDRLHALSSGNPLFLQELVQTLQERREVELRGGHWQYATPAPSVPGGVRDLVEERVLRLGAHVEDALSAASVTGMEVRFDILLAASGLGIDALLRALDRALDARILEEVGPRYVFRHPLVRAALYDRIPQQRRRHLHGTVGRAVESISPDDVEALAHHFVNSGEDERAIVHLERAGDRAAMVFANEAAIEFYEDAAARAAKRLDMQVYARISGKLGNVLSILGKYAEAEAAYNEALGHAGDPAQRSALWRALARTWEKRGEFGRALGILDAAQAEAQAAGTMLPAAERVDVLVSRAEAFLGLARFDEASALARSALAILETEPDEVRQAQVHHVEGRIAGLQGDDAAALEIFKRGLAVAEDAGDMRGMAACLTALAVVATHLGDTESADAYQRRSIQIAERMGDQHTAAIGWNNLGVSAHARGEFELARECYRKSLATREEIDDKQGLAVSWINLGEAALFQGDLDEAEEDCRKSLDLYLEINDAYGIAYVKATRAAVAFNRGNLCDAERCWHESLEIRREIGDGPGVVDCELGLAQVSIAMAKLGEAYHAARRARRTASGRAPELEARAALVQARVRVLEGRTRQAEPLIARAGRLVEEHKLGRLAVHVLLAEASRRLAGHGVAGARDLVAQAEEEARRRGLHLEAGQARHLLDRVPEGGDSLARESRWLPAAIYV